ncbi:WcbI family polysaccharide biosynthesis putative acetyltransferase [Shewanella youngdeokensis]|uniref:WcbI family polysaccharide biosynthesis putative acetyltransferase n=1 Tax=Shewanella youngdeokensis TaxID=2999068 RepID=A0ABZ0K3D8_9GAMM|nr:WcbI family polysaccharide biosynthesis putative acetyltransferase [Shewanella sp. DAU334]
MKKFFTVFGNCQAGPLADILMKQPFFAAEYEYIPMPKAAYMLKQGDYDAVCSILNKVDLFIHQEVSDAFGPLFNTKHLKTLLGPTGNSISFPSIYFSGYHPEICYLRQLGEPAKEFSDYHDFNLVNNFLNDPSSAHAKTLAAINDPDYYSSQFVLENAKNSLAELQRREQSLDITLSDFIEDNWLNEILFFSMNHPNRKVLNELAARIIAKLGLVTAPIAGSFHHLSESTLPVYASVLKHINSHKTLALKIKDTPINTPEYLDNHLAVYNKLPKAKLQSNMKALDNMKQTSPHTLKQKTIYFHIGMSKTGTTSVQKWLAEHSKLLLTHGLLYPKSFRNEGVCHHSFAKSLKSGFNDKAELEKLFTEIDHSGASKIIISSELLERLSINQCKLLNTIFSRYHIKIITYLRQQDEAVTSMYNELAKKHAIAVSFDEYIRTTPRLNLFHYTVMLAPFEQVFGIDNLIVRSFSKRHLHDKSTLSDLLLQIESSLLELVKQHPANTTNTSLLPATAHIMAEVNRHQDFAVNHLTDYALAIRLSNAVNRLAKDNGIKHRYFSSNEQRSQFLLQFKEDNQLLEHKYLNGIKFVSETMSDAPELSEQEKVTLLTETLEYTLKVLKEQPLTSEQLAEATAKIWHIILQKNLKPI